MTPTQMVVIVLKNTRHVLGAASLNGTVDDASLERLVNKTMTVSYVGPDPTVPKTGYVAATLKVAKRDLESFVPKSVDKARALALSPTAFGATKDSTFDLEPLGISADYDRGKDTVTLTPTAALAGQLNVQIRHSSHDVQGQIGPGVTPVPFKLPDLASGEAYVVFIEKHVPLLFKA